MTNIVAIAAGGDSYPPTLALMGHGPPVMQAALLEPKLDTSGFSVSVPTQTGRVYRLEYKTSLANAD